MVRHDSSMSIFVDHDLSLLSGHPKICSFTLMLENLEPESESWIEMFAKDETGFADSLVLYLGQLKAEYLMKCLTSITWSMEEPEAQMDEVAEGKLL